MKSLVSVYLIVFALACSYGQTSLQYTLKKGDSFSFRQNADQVISQEIEGTAHQITNNINGLLSFEVLGEKEGSYEIELRFKELHLKMTSSIQGELMNVNATEVKEDDIQSKIFNSLLNNPVLMTLAKNGDIIEVQGGDSLVNKMANASGLEDEFSLNMMKKSLEKEFGSKALSESYEQLTYIYPLEKVEVGDSWQNKYTGNLIADNTWKLAALTDGIATISGTGDVTISIAEPNSTMNLIGSQITEIRTELGTGLILEMRVEGEAKGTSTMLQLGDQEIPTTIKSTITYQLIK